MTKNFTLPPQPESFMRYQSLALLISSASHIWYRFPPEESLFRCYVFSFILIMGFKNRLWSRQTFLIVNKKTNLLKWRELNWSTCWRRDKVGGKQRGYRTIDQKMIAFNRFIKRTQRGAWSRVKVKDSFPFYVDTVNNCLFPWVDAESAIPYF